MFKDFPSLHPLTVHFPIVLILLAAAFQTVLVWKDWKQIRWATLIIMAVAFFSAVAASTFFHADPMPNIPKAALEMFEAHEKYAQLTVWMSGITLLLKCIGIFFKIQKRPYEIIVLIAAIIASIFLTITGHHGARLTHIAGVGPMGRYLMKEHGVGDDMKGMDMKVDSTMKMNDKIPGIDTMNNMKGLDSMKNMKGMDNMKGTKSMDKMKNIKGKDTMKNMKGMDNMKEIKSMDKMKDMKGMDTMKEMKGMDNMKDMKGMNMQSSAMDTLRFSDNNPARKKSNKPNKQ